MTKKILVILFLLFTGVVVIFSYHFYKTVKAPISTNTLNAVPQNAAIILQESNFQLFYERLHSSSIIWKELTENTDTGKQLETQLHFFDSIISHQKINLLLNKQPFTASIHLAGAKNYNFIFYVPTITEIEENQLIQEIKQLTKSNPSTRDYENVTIYQFPINSKEKIALIYHKNVIAFSYSSILIEDVIRQLSSDNSLLNDASFNTILNTSGQVEDGNLLVNHRYFPKLPSLWLNTPSKEAMKQLSNYAQWSALDVSIKNNSIALNGFTLANDSATHFLSLFKNQKPQDLEMLNVIPDHVAFMYYYGLSNSKDFFKERTLFLKSQNQFFNYQKHIDELNENYQIDVEAEFLNLIGNELAFIITEPLTDNYDAEKYVILHASSVDKLKEALSNFALKMNAEPLSTLNYNDYLINKIDFENTFSTLFGHPFFNIQHPYYTFMDDYLIFGSTQESIQRIINKNRTGRTLAKDENFNSFNNNLSSNSSIFIYHNIARSVHLYPHFLTNEYVPQGIEKTDFIRKFEAVAMQVTPSKNNLYYTNIYFKYNPVYKQDTRTVWETKLDSSITSKPEIVINHTNNTKEIFVQDEGNKIYLISNMGKILWTKQLQEKIMGKVHQIDVYKNNKLQYLFNTKSKIYVIDRNGNNVENFPVKLPQPASNGITPLDYNNTKNYRLLIGCEDNMVYNYDATGNRIKGWEYQSGESAAIHSIWHFIIKNKDYIVIPLQDGKVRIVERSGKDRVRLTNKLSRTNHPIRLTLNNELKNVYLTAMDTAGNVTKLYFNNVMENLNFSGVTPSTHFDYFDLNNDRKNEFILIDENEIRVFDMEKNKLFETEIESNITAAPLLFKMPDKSKKMGIVTASNIYLIDDTGSIVEDFPLHGSTPFIISDLNNDNSLNLVVADQQVLYMYNLK